MNECTWVSSLEVSPKNVVLTIRWASSGRTLGNVQFSYSIQSDMLFLQPRWLESSLCIDAVCRLSTEQGHDSFIVLCVDRKLHQHIWITNSQMFLMYFSRIISAQVESIHIYVLVWCSHSSVWIVHICQNVTLIYLTKLTKTMYYFFTVLFKYFFKLWTSLISLMVSKPHGMEVNVKYVLMYKYNNFKKA